ncbi:hypothetical protein IHQ68_08920 [Chelatococcus sambhunathii]|uniref:Uncharacterized protein n=1 Tax=Chelatococcus sambhunathii TaxID=363953 RepID=A0ABU1DFF6_9HYPH|nr:hypothetical protein [Chelatococcus sambhunathii]MDR4306739.1 hypothetical protein [Chelatococcus sambhunathii]
MSFHFHGRRLALILAALLSVQAAVAAPEAKPSDSFQVGLQDDDRFLAAVPLKKGSALAAFANADDILVRLVKKTGTVKGAKPIAVNGKSISGIRRAAMAKLTTGQIAIAWVGLVGIKEAVFARVVKPKGAPASDEVPVSDDELANNSDASVVALAKGKFAVIWRSETDEGESGIKTQLFKASGDPVGKPATITGPGGASVVSPVATHFGDGFVVVYALTGGKQGVLAQRFSAKGKPQGGALRLDSDNKLVHEEPAVAPLASGGYAAVWRESAFAGGDFPVITDTVIRGRFVNADGQKQALIALDDDAGDRTIERFLAPVETKAGLLVGWSVVIEHDDFQLHSDIRGAFVSDKGKAGAVAPLTKSIADSEAEPHLVELADDRVLLGFTSSPAEASSRPHGAVGSFLEITD